MKLINLTNPAVDLTQLARLCEQADTVLLRQDAVYLAHRNDITWPCNNIIALGTDVRIRNVSPIAAIGVISAAEWVELTVTATQVLLWR
ncbi:DsrH/TusB family sulfur metabolism protein [Arsukibacterium sp.]|uniref:DsrH/TusB family sulfur metabolism protein n=1 Tax=Arsukibacterium sp. TaxID=1977258 RepID=UPI001BD36449|nr:DsrH/TusB family sulfur metabolism protein [Arsukibacterium sp.]